MGQEIVIKYYGPLRSVVGCREEVMAVPDGTRVRQVLAALAEKYGPAFSESVSPAGASIDSSVIVALSGQDIEHLKGLETPVEGDAKLEIIKVVPLIGG